MSIGELGSTAVVGSIRNEETAAYDKSTNAHSTSKGEVLLSVEHVRFTYGKNTVLTDVSLEVARGSCVCLMGINGCGKSTLLDCVLGAHKTESGTIVIEGRSVASMKPAELAQKVSYVPQVHERSFPYLVDHIVLMGRSAYARGIGAPDFGDLELVAQALDDCGIAHLAKRPYTTLSGGEMQMVMLARALVQDAHLIIMDEPTAHLDFKNELKFLEMVEHLVKERQVTVLWATHAPNQAFHLANAGVPTRVAVMHEGRVFATGSPREVLTENLLARVFGIQAVLLERAPAQRELLGTKGGDNLAAGEEGNFGAEAEDNTSQSKLRPIRQIVPQRTLRPEEIAGAVQVYEARLQEDEDA